MPGLSLGSLGSAASAKKKEEEKVAALKKKEKSGQRVAETVGGVTSGAVEGLATGGVPGAIVGGGLGVAGSLIDANKTPEDPNRPERRGVARISETIKASKNKKLQALASLSAAVSDFAAGIR